tara:strand:+ start:474 stop:593 length:120 start_codon:yes stop_codon:yes gene_type:complete
MIKNGLPKWTPQNQPKALKTNEKSIKINKNIGIEINKNE